MMTDSILQIIKNPMLLKLIKIIFLIFMGYVFYLIMAISLLRPFKQTMRKQTYMLIKKLAIYVVALLILFVSLNELGFNLTSILGAAGIFGVAIGFASQTSFSNIISGLFIVSENAFEAGDIIEFDGVVGTVESIDSLSIKLLQFDNKIVRIPNESILKNKVINFTKHLIRRMDLTVGIAYKEDIAKTMALLEEIIDQNPLCFDEPKPLILFKGFGESSLDIMVGVWFERNDFKLVKNSLLITIKQRFDAEGIEIPFPHISLYAGEASTPIKVMNTSTSHSEK